MAKMLNRSNQAIRRVEEDEGRRNVTRGSKVTGSKGLRPVNNEKKVPSGRGPRNTAATAPAAGEQQKTVSRINKRNPAAETSSNTTLSMSPGKEQNNAVSVGERSVEHEISISHGREPAWVRKCVDM